MSGAGMGTLILSIDLELDLEHHEALQQRRLDEIRSQLVSLTRDAAIPATWAVADPMLSAATESILSAGCGHEIAVLGDQAWLGPGCGRARLTRELTRRVTAPRIAGIPVSTIALRNVEQVADWDLLIKSGVTTICDEPVESPSLARRQGQPPLRFGIWQPPVAWRLPPRTNWWSPANWLIRGEINRAIRHQSLLHLRLDVQRLVDAPDGSADLVVSTLHYIAAQRDAGRLTVETIGRLAAQALHSRSALPSRSILRPAA
jgi:hypothetical protein